MRAKVDMGGAFDLVENSVLVSRRTSNGDRRLDASVSERNNCSSPILSGSNVRVFSPRDPPRQNSAPQQSANPLLRPLEWDVFDLDAPTREQNPLHGHAFVDELLE
jgi:hypothetical protein